MKESKTIAAALDLSEMDKSILEYTKIFANSLNLKKLDLVHIIPQEFVLTGREHGMPEGSSLINLVQKNVKAKIQKYINTHFPKSTIDVTIHVLEGNPDSQLLSFIEAHKIELLIVGRKEETSGSGITAKRLLRKANCNFLFVPSNANTTPRRIMVPIDFSDNSAEAVYAALLMKMSDPDLEITCPHVIRMLPADYYFNMDKLELYKKAHFAKNKNAFEKFVEDNDIPEAQINQVLLTDEKNNIGQRLKDYQINKGFDLVIIGAEKHKLMDRFFYGSISERFMQYYIEVPILVVR